MHIGCIFWTLGPDTLYLSLATDHIHWQVPLLDDLLV